MWREFKEFALRGNMLDLAVGVMIGAAFGKIIDSLVKDLIMPPLGMLTGGLDFSKQFVVLRGVEGKGPWSSVEEAAKDGAITLNYGLFLTGVIQFLIIAAALFLVVKGANTLRRKQEEAPAEAPPAPQDVVLLEEIRDILKQRA